MKFTFTVTIIVFTLFTAFGQDWDSDSITQPTRNSSNSYLPADCLESTFLIEKLEEINAQELSLILNKKKVERNEEISPALMKYMDNLEREDRIIHGANFYNTVSMVKVNQEIETIISKESDINLASAYKSDIIETPRYTIRSKFNFEAAADPECYMSYSIFDNEENRSYKSFHSLEILLKSINLSKTYMAFSPSRNQGDLDTYLDSKVTRLERKAAKKGSGLDSTNFFIVLGAVLSGFILIMNIATN